MFMQAKEFHISSVEQLSEVSDYLLSMRNESDIIAFYGSMGAGKTTLIKNLCHRMGVTDEVNSPTFAIVNEYVTKEGESVYHFDFYRIKRLSQQEESILYQLFQVQIFETRIVFC